MIQAEFDARQPAIVEEEPTEEPIPSNELGEYDLNLKFTKLEAPEVGLWTKTVQVASHEEDQQLPKQLALPQQLE